MKIDEDTQHLRTMEADLLGCIELIDRLATSEHKTYCDAARYKLLTHAATLKGMADGLETLKHGDRLN